MNAGRGREHNLSIYDFVKSMKVFENGKEKTLSKEELNLSYRKTNFTGIQNTFITSAIFEFPSKNFDDNPILKRVKWSQEFQEHTKANCGSVFKTWDFRIMKFLQGFKFFGAWYSAKTLNWISNSSDSSFPIQVLIKISIFLHKILGKKISLEIIEID